VRAALVSLAAAAGCITAGAVAFSLTQHTGFLTALYWSVATGSTVGYGDVTAHDTAGKLISIAVMLTAIPLLASAFSHLHLHRHRKMQRDTESERQ
jgi:voltage-gated potassium channel